MIKALIFDVDGTLAETEELHRAAFNDAFVEFGLDWHWSMTDYHRLLKTTGGKERMRVHADETGTSLSSEEIAKIHKRKTAHYADLMAKGDIAPREGIVSLMDAARVQNIRMAIATTTNLPNVEALCQAMFKQTATEVFDTIAAGDMVKHKKPAPDVYQLALTKLALPADQCIALEDSRNGVLAAQAAGLRVIHSPARYTQDERDAGADYLIDEFDQATNIIETL